MSTFEQSRYYFNDVLPDIILSNVETVNIFVSQFWYIFFILSILLLIALMNSFRKNVKMEQIFQKYDDFFKIFSKQEDVKDIKTFLLEGIKLSGAEYGAIYELRGETYLLTISDTSQNTKLAAPLRIGRKELNKFIKSGNFRVDHYVSSSAKSMMLLYSTKRFDLEKYSGHYQMMLGYLECALGGSKSKGGEALMSVSKDTSLSLMKLQMDKNQFFKFFVALILKITKAMGARLLTKEGELVFEYSAKKGASLQKVFYIRNTPYKLEFYDNKSLDMQTTAQVGSFLDMAGAFLINIDKNSEMVANYLNLLKFTNQAIELENVYYKNHSLIVQTVSVEIAKSLFLSEEDIDAISLGALLHDIGMIGDLLAVLDKMKLEDKEMNLIKEHPLIGSIMVEPICHIYPISDIVKYHHERFDGRGYPFGLKESQIPVNAQVVALAEFYAGVTGDRSYKKGKTHEEAVDIIKDLRDKMFSSIMIDSFLDVEKSVKVKIDKLKARNERDEAEK